MLARILGASLVPAEAVVVKLNAKRLVRHVSHGRDAMATLNQWRKILLYWDGNVSANSAASPPLSKASPNTFGVHFGVLCRRMGGQLASIRSGAPCAGPLVMGPRSLAGSCSGPVLSIFLCSGPVWTSLRPWQAWSSLTSKPCSGRRLQSKTSSNTSCKLTLLNLAAPGALCASDLLRSPPSPVFCRITPPLRALWIDTFSAVHLSGSRGQALRALEPGVLCTGAWPNHRHYCRDCHGAFSN